MIRNIFVTLLFFFGPALLMFVLRNMFLAWRHRRIHKKPDVIDITPINPSSPSRFFVMSAVTVGIIFGYLAWSQINHDGDTSQGTHYTPAYVNAQGELVPESRTPRQ